MKVDFFEDPLEEANADRKDAAVTNGGTRVHIPLGPFEIATVEITFEPKDES